MLDYPKAFLIFDLISCFFFNASLAYYLITNLQWYNYSLMRVLTKHHKKQWHVYYFILPLLCFLLLHQHGRFVFFYLILYLVWLPLIFLWYKKLDKKLVWTNKALRFMGYVLLITLISYLLALMYKKESYQNFIILSSFIIVYMFWQVSENLFFLSYALKAKQKLQTLDNLIVIAITGSYGKTSTKNFLAAILGSKFNIYATPRSVNTYKGLVSDINNYLSSECKIYIAEAGARNKGDIAQISRLLNQHYGIIGKIGNAHIEYFKDIQKTTITKFEMLYSNRLIKAFVQRDNQKPKSFPKRYEANLQKIVTYPPLYEVIESNLFGTRFNLDLGSEKVEFETEVLGLFNIDNIAVAILLAKELGMTIEEIQKAVSKLKHVQHRLQKITTPQKIILDDSFNGNLEGMSEAIRLSATHHGRKIIVTPGLVEYDKQSNVLLAEKIDSVFDIAIITGSLNAQLLDKHIVKAEKILLQDKTKLESLLATIGQDNDLVLFANDAPNYI